MDDAEKGPTVKSPFSISKLREKYLFRYILLVCVFSHEPMRKKALSVVFYFRLDRSIETSEAFKVTFFVSLSISP